MKKSLYERERERVNKKEQIDHETDFIMEESSNQDLASYLAANPVPCFAHVTRGSRQTQHGVSNHRPSEAAAAVDHCDVVYLYKEFTARCLFAKSYNNMFENYLLHHRPSYVPSEDEFSSSGNEMSWATRDKLHHTLRSDIFVFNDIVTIPFNYPGLFEVFSSNSVKRGGILDHETDLISFASRLRKPKSYYVAKEMKVYELITNPSSPPLQSQNNQQNAPTNKADSTSTMSPVSQQVISVSKRNLSRKWSRIPVGSVCRAVRLVSLDGCTNNVIENKSHHGGGIHTPFWLLHVIKELLCCQFEKKAKKNSDLAIELKLVKQLSDLDVSSGNTVSSKLDNDKTYFLPVYESAALENEIDLIPLSTFKNNRFKSNCLHLAKNFVLNDQFLLGNYIELKLFDENPFNKALSIKGDMKKQPLLKSPPPPKSPQTQNSLVNSNQHIEKDKYISIFDLIEYRAQCKFVVGFNLTSNTLFVIPNIPVDSEKFLRIKPRFSRLNQVDAQTKTMLDNFTSAPNMTAFISAAQLEIDKFDHSLNRIEIFDNSDFVHSNDEEADGDVKINSSPKPNIIKHFSDLVNVDSEDHQSDHTGSDEFKSASEIQEKLSDRKMSRIKYRTMPMKNSSGCKMSRNEMNRASSLNNFNIISL